MLEKSPSPLRKAAMICGALFAALLGMFLVARVVSAFNGPTANPPSGYGAISVSGNNVGIGTSTPGSQLDLEGINNSYITIGDNSGDKSYLQSYNGGFGRVGSLSNQGFQITADTSPVITALTSGNVGIGTTTPSQKLEVNGNAQIDNNLNVNGTITGNYGGTVTAGNISAGQFGSNTGGGNYSFPASVDIGTTTASAELFVQGGTYGTTGQSNQSAYAIGASSIAADKSIFSYGSICDQNSVGNCTGSGGVVLGANNTSAAINIPVSGSTFFNNGSNVGVGTTTPGYKLDVEGGQINSSGGYCINGANCITSWPSGGGGGGSGTVTSIIAGTGLSGGTITSSGTIALNLGNANTWTGAQTFNANSNFPGSGIWNTSGNLGIGTTSPSQLLEVNGNAQIDNNLTVNGTITGSYGGTITAGNVSAGQFGSNTGGGNYSFSANVGIGGKLGVGTTTNSSTLFVVGSSTILDPNNDNAFTVDQNGTSRVLQFGSNGFYDNSTAAFGGTWGSHGSVEVYGGGNVRPAFYVSETSGGNDPAMVLNYSGTNSATSSWMQLGSNAIVNGNPSGTVIGANNPSSMKADFINFEQNSSSIFDVGANSTTISTLVLPNLTSTILATNAQGLIIATTTSGGGGGSGTVTSIIAGTGLSGGTITSSGTLAVNYGSSTSTAVQGNTSIAISAGSGLSGGGSITLGAGGTQTLSLNLANANTWTGTQNFNVTSTFSSGVNITGKLTVGTIDPLYRINGTNYATYGTDMTGVKEQTAGTLELAKGSDGKYRETIDFAHEPQGSDLWLFAQATDLAKNLDQMVVTLTPSFDGNVWYVKDATGDAVTIYAQPASGSPTPSTLEVSYNLTAPRFDASQWPNLAPADEQQLPAFVIGN
jgi:hypothetical protein